MLIYLVMPLARPFFPEPQDQRNYGGDGHALLAFMYGTGSGGEKDMAQARAQLALAEEKGARIHPGLKELVMGSPEYVWFVCWVDFLVHVDAKVYLHLRARPQSRALVFSASPAFSQMRKRGLVA